MSKARAKSPAASFRGGKTAAGQAGLPLPIDKIIASQRLSRAIEAAHENGALLSLASHLELLLKEFPAKNEMLTAARLEELIAVAARVMGSNQYE